MNAVDLQFTALTEKLQQLLRQMASLQRENAQLRAELQASRAAEATALEQVDELKQQSAVLKYAAGEMNERDKKEFERKINQYIRQIDKCIAYLGQ